jgi:hypothetical protein
VPEGEEVSVQVLSSTWISWGRSPCFYIWLVFGNESSCVRGEKWTYGDDGFLAFDT